MASLDKRINISCCNKTSPQGLIEATTVDPWNKSGKYALGWVYFAIILLLLTSALRWYNFWNDKIRVALHKESLAHSAIPASPEVDHELDSLKTGNSKQGFFAREVPLPDVTPQEPVLSSLRPLNVVIALFRLVFYRPLPAIRLKTGWRPVTIPSVGVMVIVSAAMSFAILYCFLPQPLYWQSLRFGSPPLAIRAGMIAVAMMPWIVALSMKTNLISMITGIGHERLNVLHRWLAYLFLLLSLIHTVPFYITPLHDHAGSVVFQSYFSKTGIYIYGTGVAALVPLIFLCVHSIPPLRHRMYELFAAAHVPVSIVLLAMLFWHCNNYLTSWNYLFATLAIWMLSYFARVFKLNWSNPRRISFLVGEESALTLLPENAIKITIPTQQRWKPGQYVYLRMPGVAFFENHPFTVASLCSDDFPSPYGDGYRDMVLVFRPWGGFTKKVLETALEHGPWYTYRTFLDGPYGGMRRNMTSFDHVVMVAGGSGITAIVSQLLDLINRMRNGKAVTKTVQLIWAMKRPETMEWFKEELRICREFAPANAVTCQLYVTSAKRGSQKGNALGNAQSPNRPISMGLHDKVDGIFQHIASNRYSTGSAKRNSALILNEANGDAEKEQELRAEDLDRPRPLPEAHVRPARNASLRNAYNALEGRAGDPLEAFMEQTPHLPPHPTLHQKRRQRPLSLDITSAKQPHFMGAGQAQDFDFGFPSTPTEFQKNLMRFAFMPATTKARKSGWSTEWGRPDIPYMLREMSKEWSGKRTCVFVCGPPGMRVAVSRTVADLQKLVLRNKDTEEIYLHAENYGL